MTKEEKDFLEKLTKDIGLSVTFTDSVVIIGSEDQLTEPIELPITISDLSVIRDIKVPLINKVEELLDCDDSYVSDYEILNNIKNRL